MSENFPLLDFASLPPELRCRFYKLVFEASIDKLDSNEWLRVDRERLYCRKLADNLSIQYELDGEVRLHVACGRGRELVTLEGWEALTRYSFREVVIAVPKGAEDTAFCARLVHSLSTIYYPGLNIDGALDKVTFLSLLHPNVRLLCGRTPQHCDYSFAEVFERLPNIEDFRYEFDEEFGYFTNEDLKSMVRCCKRLKSLDIQYVCVDADFDFSLLRGLVAALSSKRGKITLTVHLNDGPQNFDLVGKHFASQIDRIKLPDDRNPVCDMKIIILAAKWTDRSDRHKHVFEYDRKTLLLHSKN